MTTASKHMARSHRTYRDNKAMLGTFSQRSYYSHQSKQRNTDKLRILKPIARRITDLKEKLSVNISKMFRRQDRG